MRRNALISGERGRKPYPHVVLLVLWLSSGFSHWYRGQLEIVPHCLVAGFEYLGYSQVGTALLLLFEKEICPFLALSAGAKLFRKC